MSEVNLLNLDPTTISNGPRQANLVLIAYASSEGSGEPAHPRSLARTSAARSYKQWVKRNLQTESKIPGPSEWLGMHSWNLSRRNAWRHKFAWRGLNDLFAKKTEADAVCLRLIKTKCFGKLVSLQLIAHFTPKLSLENKRAYYWKTLFFC